MDYLAREDLKELLQDRQPPAISLYVPTRRTSSEWETNRLRFRGALERAQELLEPDYEPSTYRPLLETLEPLLDDQEFWLHQGDSLAVFRAPDFLRAFRLPTRVEELVVVAPSFHTRPLIQLLQSPDRFWVLSLSQGEVRLWEGTSLGLRPVDLGNVPESLMQAVSVHMDYERESFHSSLGPGRQPAYHGHGPGLDGKGWELEAFARKVDRGLRDLLDPEAGPLVLAGPEEVIATFRGVSHLSNLAEESIRGNVSTWNADRLHKAAWPLVERLAETKVDEALRLWESAYGLEKVESDVSASSRFAVAGRVRLMMTDRDRHLWGHLDRGTGAIEVVSEEAEDPGNNAVDLLDELAELTILYGGQALALPGERMPTETGVATVLR